MSYWEDKKLRGDPLAMCLGEIVNYTTSFGEQGLFPFGVNGGWDCGCEMRRDRGGLLRYSRP